MSSACRSLALLLFGAAALVVASPLAGQAAGRELRVCADPNNLPFSNEQFEGFENKIVDVLARALDATPRYTWWAQRRGFVRNTLNSLSCDLVPGIGAGLGMLRTTAPYYRSTYVFVTRPEQAEILSLDDPALRTLKIGVHLIGDDGFNVPPAHALARRGIIANVRGYSIYGDYRDANPPARLIEAVRTGEIDVAIAWGPLGGYFAALQDPPLRVSPVHPLRDGSLPMTYAVAMGVRRADAALAEEVDTALKNRRPEIEAILKRYAVPEIPAEDAGERAP